MSYSLSFSSEFFLSEGEPYDRGEYTEQEREYPTSVWMALETMSADEWTFLVGELFPQWDSGRFGQMPVDAVFSMIEETDACTDLRTPVEVWIDAEGYHTVKVYESSE